MTLLEPRIEPEPDEAERQAILLALESAGSGAAEPAADAYRSAWREAGIRESVDASDGG